MEGAAVEQNCLSRDAGRLGKAWARSWEGLEGDSLVLTVEALLGSAVQPLGSKAQTDVLFRPVLISTNSISSLKGPKESGRGERPL